MKEELVDLIKYIQSEKEKRTRYPYHAMKIEILKVLRLRTEQYLKSLCDKGVLKQISTINDEAYEIIEKGT